MHGSREGQLICKWKKYILPWVVSPPPPDMFKPSPDHNMTELLQWAFDKLDHNARIPDYLLQEAFPYSQGCVSSPQGISHHSTGLITAFHISVSFPSMRAEATLSSLDFQFSAKSPAHSRTSHMASLLFPPLPFPPLPNTLPRSFIWVSPFPSPNVDIQ